MTSWASTLQCKNKKTCTIYQGIQLSMCIILGMSLYEVKNSSREFSVNFSIGMDSYCIENGCFGVLFICFVK